MNEQQLQAKCVIAFRNKVGRFGHGLMVEINNNETNIVAGARRKAMGLIKGFPDTQIIVKDKVFFIEFKSEKGRQKPEQIVLEDLLNKLGFSYYICRTYEEFKRIIEFETNFKL